MWQGGDFPFELLDQIRWREGKMREKKERKKRAKKRRGVRSSTFSLGLTEIGLSVFVEARGKVHPRDEASRGAKIQGFRQTPRGRGFSPTRFYSWSKSHSNGMRFLEP